MTVRQGTAQPLRAGSPGGRDGNRRGRGVRPSRVARDELGAAISSSGAAVASTERPYPWGTYCWMCVVQYDGGEFCGFQLQRGVGGNSARLPSVQGALESALGTALQCDRHALQLTAAGRTDAGVHARAQVVSFHTARDIPDAGRLVRSLNALLPPAVRVCGVVPMPPDFSARYGVLSKTYTYDLHIGACVGEVCELTDDTDG